ncbi:hypothetical protein [Thalassobacillus sp. C254]|uniref:hypothetical protein n=1 Tax=Thalassobacillus sp. C254 TaxID=1225341 RepID=UPI0006CFB987|nr:hypothetical protein [Thalassobacillus sp. C254]
MRELRKQLIKEIEKNKEGELAALFNILKESKFGIRQPLIPILLVSLLKDYWDHILIYKNGMVVNDLTGNALYGMLQAQMNMFIIIINLTTKNSFL